MEHSHMRSVVEHMMGYVLEQLHALCTHLALFLLSPSRPEVPEMIALE